MSKSIKNLLQKVDFIYSKKMTFKEKLEWSN